MQKIIWKNGVGRKIHEAFLLLLLLLLLLMLFPFMFAFWLLFFQFFWKQRQSGALEKKCSEDFIKLIANNLASRQSLRNTCGRFIYGKVARWQYCTANQRPRNQWDQNQKLKPEPLNSNFEQISTFYSFKTAFLYFIRQNLNLIDSSISQRQRVQS